MINHVPSFFKIKNSFLMMSFSREFGLGENHLLNLLKTAPLKYKTYYIKKRDGVSEREISQPTPEVKFIQRWLVENYLNNFPIHESATAYEKGKSIRDNALPHAKNNYLMKIDFKDFFPSIKPDDIFNAMHNSTLSMDDKIVLSQILFKAKGKDGSLFLSIGAPSSPKVSNIVMYQIDSEISLYCRKNNIAYTRYADDLTFSTNTPNLLKECLAEIRKILTETDSPKLKINDQKTIYSSKKHNRTVTGLVLTNDKKVSLGRDKKRLLSARIHHFQQGKLTSVDALELKGQLAYAWAVEPDFIERMRRKYGECLNNLQHL